MQRGRLVVISGPSGVGQDTVLDLFTAGHPDWWLSVSATTRPPRPGEAEGDDMHFVSVEDFKRQEAEGKFISVAHIIDDWYGLLREPLEAKLAAGINVFARVDIPGAKAIKALYPDAMLVFINAESWEALERRLIGRHTENSAEIRERLAIDKERLRHVKEYDHVVINPTGYPERAVTALENILAG
jgi:guanylate kinase